MTEHDAFGTFDPDFTEAAPPAAWERPPAEERVKLGPHELEWWWDHKFVKKPGNRRGCAVCNEGKTKVHHHGYPPSFNGFGSGANWFAYQGIKKSFEELLSHLLARASLPKGLGYVHVEGKLIFPDRRDRDQDNYRYPLSKMLGDTLQAGKWLKKDSWDHYEFGGLAKGYEKDRAGMKLLIYPSWYTPLEREEQRAEGAQASLEL